MSVGDYYLVVHENGSTSVGCRQVGEVMHPIVGPSVEAHELYVAGLKLRERFAERRSLCIWDIGMGAAANALTAAQALRDLPGKLQIISFDRTASALAFARANAAKFGYLKDCIQSLDALLLDGRTELELDGLLVEWTYREGEFLDQLTGEWPEPEVIFFDAWSPLKNPGMWTLEVFAELHRQLKRPCSLATYSRATCVRSALLLAGFYVGQGLGVGAKEESTIAATELELLDSPLPASWLARAERSHSGRPLLADRFEQVPLPAEMLEQLRNHPQFRVDA